MSPVKALPRQAHPEMTALLKRFTLMDSKLAYWPNDVVADNVVSDAYCGSSSGEKLVIEFLLSVWDQRRDWTDLGYRNFNLSRAMGTWGAGRTAAAVAEWMAKPFFP